MFIIFFVWTLCTMKQYFLFYLFVCLFVVIDIFKNHSFSSLCLRNILASTVHVVYCTLNVMFPAGHYSNFMASRKHQIYCDFISRNALLCVTRFREACASCMTDLSIHFSPSLFHLFFSSLPFPPLLNLSQSCRVMEWNSLCICVCKRVSGNDQWKLKPVP